MTLALIPAFFEDAGFLGETMSSLIVAYRKPFQAIFIVINCSPRIDFITSLIIKVLGLERKDGCRAAEVRLILDICFNAIRKKVDSVAMYRRDDSSQWLWM